MSINKILSKEKFQILRKDLEGNNFFFKENNLIARIKINAITVFL